MFDIPTSDNHGQLAPPKCKTKKSRQSAFKLLRELAQDCKENFLQLTDELLKQHTDGFLTLFIILY